MSKQPQKRKSPARPDHVSDEVLLARIALRHTAIRGAVLFGALVGLSLMILACWPIASELAGQQTELNVSIAIGFTVTATLGGAALAYWGRQHKKRADRLDVRNKSLSRDVKELKQRLRDNKLSDKCSR